MTESNLEIQPKYLLLKELILEQIARGTYAPGARIPTQRELMAEHNLSYSTVSRALQELVREGFITRLVGSGSRVSEQARVKTGRPVCIHLVGIPAAAQRGLKMFQDLLERVRELGARLEPHEELDQAGRAALVDRVLASLRDPQGAREALVFPFFAGNRTHIDRLRLAGAPYVVLDVPLPMEGYSVVLRDHKAAARALVDRLLQAGHRPERIGLILGSRDTKEPDPLQWDTAKAEGALEALRAAGLAAPEFIEWQVGPHVEAGELAAARLFDRTGKLTALFCDNDKKAAGACRHLRARGRKIPADVSVVCINRPAEDLELPVALACAWASPEGVGRAAADSLWAQLGLGTAKAVQELPLRFEDGASIAAPRN